MNSTMSPIFLINLIFISILTLLFFTVTLYYFIRYWFLYSRVSSLPLTKVAETRSGVISVEGVAKIYNDEVILSPSQKSCAWYHYTVRTRAQSFALKRNHSKKRFLLADDTGSIVISPPKKFSLNDWYLIKEANSNTWMSDSATDSKPKKNMAFLSRSYQWTEWRIENLQPIYIYGAFERVTQANSVYGEVSKSINASVPFILSNYSKAELLSYAVFRLGWLSLCLMAEIIFVGFIIYVAVL